MRNDKMVRKVMTGLLTAVVSVSAAACGSATVAVDPPVVTVATTPPVVVVAPPPQTTCDSGQIAEIAGQFNGRVGTEAAKMEPEGPLLCGIAPEGGTIASQSFTMYPGYCYTVLGTGLPGVSDVDLQVSLDPSAQGFPPALAAMATVPLMVDNIANAITAANPTPNCYKYGGVNNPLMIIPAQVKLTVKAHVGQGAIAAQVYKRKFQ